MGLIANSVSKKIGNGRVEAEDVFSGKWKERNWRGVAGVRGVGMTEAGERRRWEG